MYHRHARPTLRLLREDLRDGWNTPAPRRLLQDGELESLHPLADLDHPIVRRAATAIKSRPSDDQVEGYIRSTGDCRLMEIKTGQWRGALWEDLQTGVHWLVAAGLAKGEHEDADDFYQQLKRKQDLAALLPAAEDIALLKKETAARLWLDWELRIQETTTQAVQHALADGIHRWTVEHPLPSSSPMAEVELSVETRDTEAITDIYVEVTANHPSGVSQDDVWNLVLRVLISLNPPIQSWDTEGSSLFFTMVETEQLRHRARELARLVQRGELAPPEPGKVSHYAHRDHLASSTVEGDAVFTLCGIYFVPTQDHEKLEVCPPCEARYQRL